MHVSNLRPIEKDVIFSSIKKYRKSDNNMATDEPTAGKEYGDLTMRIGKTHFQIYQENDILLITVDWLIAQGKLDHPVISGFKRFIVNSRPVHRDGTPFYVEERLSNGLYLEKHWDFRSLMRNARKLLKSCGFPEDLLEVYDESGNPIVIDPRR